MVHEHGPQYSLISRELIADSVELVLQGQRYDAAITLGACDKTVPGMLIPVATADVTQWRIRLGVNGGLPDRFDLVTSDVIIDGDRYPVRTFTYRWFPERKAYGLCR